MGKRGLSRDAIVEAAAVLAEREGLDQVTIQALAQELGVKASSLYNHIEGLREIIRELGQDAQRRLEEAVSCAAIGKSGGDALWEMACAYRRFACETPQLYRALYRWIGMGDGESERAGKAIMQVLYRVLDHFNLEQEEMVHQARAFRSMIHGFVSLELEGFFRSKDVDLEVTYRKMVWGLIQVTIWKGEDIDGTGAAAR